MDVVQLEVMTNYAEHLARVDWLLLRLELQLEDPADGLDPGPEPLPPELLVPHRIDMLTRIIRRFGLDPAEADLFRMACAAELSPAIADTFARLQGDRRLRRPQLALALRLLETDPIKRARLIPLLHPSHRLRHNLLVEFLPPWRDRQPMFTENELALPQPLLHQLAGARMVDPEIADAVTLVHPAVRFEQLILTEEVKSGLDRLLEGATTHLPSSELVGPPSLALSLIYLNGSYGTGRHSVAEALAGLWQCDLLEIDLRRVPEEQLGGGPIITAALRDAGRLGVIPLFSSSERLTERPGGTEEQNRQPDPFRLERFLNLAHTFPGVVMFTGEGKIPFDRQWSRRQVITFDLTQHMDEATRQHLWAQTLSGCQHTLTPADMHLLSVQYQFSPGQIRDAVISARSRAATRDRRSPLISLDDLRAGCIAQLRHNLESLSRKSKSLYRWDDLILPGTVKSQLQMFETFIRNREQVYDRWGMSRKLAMGRGLKALFYGPSGTGKTMAAQVLSATLGIDLFKVDLSSLVSKWVGETEKNLNKVFTEAEKSHAIILFDEADSLFGKRGTVEKGTDRYSNMEINYLLQRFEEYDGVVILTSNFPRGIDDAFSRRMHFMIEFPAPDAEMRERLWKTMIPEELPLGDDVDLERLAKQFDITGANIKNVVLGASFLAAERGSSVSMLDLMRAIQWEFQKIGRSSSRFEFQEFFDQLS